MAEAAATIGLGLGGAAAVFVLVVILLRLGRWRAEARDLRLLRREYVLRAVGALDDQGSALDIQQWLKRSAPRSCRLGAGSLYPLLARLEAEGVLRSRWEDKRPTREFRRRLYERASLSFEPDSPRGR